MFENRLWNRTVISSREGSGLNSENRIGTGARQVNGLLHANSCVRSTSSWNSTIHALHHGDWGNLSSHPPTQATVRVNSNRVLESGLNWVQKPSIMYFLKTAQLMLWALSILISQGVVKNTAFQTPFSPEVSDSALIRYLQWSSRTPQSLRTTVLGQLYPLPTVFTTHCHFMTECRSHSCTYCALQWSANTQTTEMQAKSSKDD